MVNNQEDGIGGNSGQRVNSEKKNVESQADTEETEWTVQKDQVHESHDRMLIERHRLI